MGSPGPDGGRRFTDRREQQTSSIESIAARATVGAPTLYKVISGLGSAASTVILALIGFVWSEVRGEWVELKAQIAESDTNSTVNPRPRSSRSSARRSNKSTID